ncbi:Protein arginine N-methyltransferase [Fusarium keratoplasticum]|uniref:Protein arginine N-methyltransferase n=1 Tax=Fusarium keratoplasticum TaxID=1328300 RepID=A0ACC0QX41_9HYPO|nr:Protein arginine N-methyltransferase [Fusarium keratoplasticum]KAI8668945.1 Protein arginine N-methyltransferase [Fusarium keratoplasticum]KAI8673550.1 Protein arginine N-methyltransferase [Fusarium keratoplasticum]
MASDASGFDMSDSFGPQRPSFNIGYHDSNRDEPLTDLQYGHLLNHGLAFATTPITNTHFRERVFALVSEHLAALSDNGENATTTATGSRAEPILPPLTPKDTSMFPCAAVNTYTAVISPWIDLGSANPIISNISRQVLNVEVNYANFCGVRSIIIPGPRQDASIDGGNQSLAQYSRAVEEALTIGNRLTFLIHMPMYREPEVESQGVSISSLEVKTPTKTEEKEIDLLAAWDSWHHVRSVCNYNTRLFVALQIPRVMPEKDLQDRWFAEPLHYLTINPGVFQANKAGYPSLSKHHQNLFFSYMRLKNAPWILLCDAGPDVSHIKGEPHSLLASHDDFPTLAEAESQNQTAKTANFQVKTNDYISYLRWLESQQPEFTYLEGATLTSFQDWLQSPLQPLSDNLESATYEVFEGDPVKYSQYEVAVYEALTEWKELNKPTSKEGKVVVAVAGSGRGPLVTRALKASKDAGVPIDMWAVEKNPNAYVYLLRQNELVWNGEVKVVKTDMRAWKGPIVSETEDGPVYGKVDILISELLGSFGDNELSPECLDGIQHVISTPHGISIPSSYTAHLSPISTPKIHADILSRSPGDPNAFETPWVVRLFALDFVAEKVPNKPRFQEAWEFAHPIPESTLAALEAKRSGGVVGGGGGSMAGAAGANDHNSRYCHLTFVCRTRGVTHGLAGYFESTLYESQIPENKGEKIEISTHPERIDRKSKDMISWFPIFFPLKNPLYFPADTELEVSMWRQTDDTRVWYEWLVEAFTWVGPSTRIKVASSDLCSSRKVACLM